MSDYRIRRCKGNRRFWVLVPLRDDGSEIETYLTGSTALHVSTLRAKVPDGSSVEIVEDYAFELTPAGEQTVIPGCERNCSERVRQLDLFG